MALILYLVWPFLLAQIAIILYPLLEKMQPRRIAIWPVQAIKMNSVERIIGWTSFGTVNPLPLRQLFPKKSEIGLHWDVIGKCSIFNASSIFCILICIPLSDNVNNTRTLSAMAVPPGQVTLENCTTVCFKSGFRFSGAEYSTYVNLRTRASWFRLTRNRECYCGSIIAHTAGPATLTDCNTPCAGNTSELCGGANRLSLYNYTGTDLPPRATMNVFPLKSGLPMPWAYNACWA